MERLIEEMPQQHREALLEPRCEVNSKHSRYPRRHARVVVCVLLKDDGHDLLVCPVMLAPAWPIGEPAAAHTGMFAAPFSFTGQPALVVPATMTSDGRPVGVQLVARLGADEMLLALGAALQPILGWLDRRPADPRPSDPPTGRPGGPADTADG